MELTPNTTYLDTRYDIKDVVRATKVFGSFVASGMKLVDQPLAESRADTCARCPANVQVAGCSSCVGMVEVVASVTGTKKTRADAMITNRSCAWCKCATKAQVWMPAETLAKGVTQEMLDSNPFKEHCWKFQEITALQAEKALPVG